MELRLEPVSSGHEESMRLTWQPRDFLELRIQPTEDKDQAGGRLLE